jgi:putative NIF3 family GTP cyclohydrolase 1 type 2
VLSGIDSDTVVSSDIPHHVLKELLEKNKNVVVIPHYVSENYGFNEFFKVVEKALLGKVETFYFEDKRFM